jgi:hypothetical protein
MRLENSIAALTPAC